MAAPTAEFPLNDLMQIIAVSVILTPYFYFTFSSYFLHMVNLWNLRSYPKVHLGCAIITGGFLIKVCTNSIPVLECASQVCLPDLKTLHSDAYLIKLQGFVMCALGMLVASWFAVSKSMGLLRQIRRQSSDTYGWSRPQNPPLRPADTCMLVVMSPLFLVTILGFNYGFQNSDYLRFGAARLTVVSALCSLVGSAMIYTSGPLNCRGFVCCSMFCALPAVVYIAGRTIGKGVILGTICFRMASSLKCVSV